MRRTEGSEPSQYLEEEKSKEIPSVAASEHGRAQTARLRPSGVVGPDYTELQNSSLVEGSGTARQRR
jgi:hypothetical protein